MQENRQLCWFFRSWPAHISLSSWQQAARPCVYSGLPHYPKESNCLNILSRLVGQVQAGEGPSLDVDLEKILQFFDGNKRSSMTARSID